MKNKRNIFIYAISISLCVLSVFAIASAVTTVGNSISVGNNLTVDGTASVSGAFYGNSTATFLGTASSSFAGHLTVAGDFNINSGKMYVDASSGNVGIGTTAPGYKLDVNGAINGTSVLINGVAVGTGGVSKTGDTMTGNLTVPGTISDAANIGSVFVGKMGSVYCVGDSLTAAGVYPEKLRSLLGVGWAVYNAGHSGYTATQVLSAFAADVTNYRVANYTVVLAGINDVVGDATAASIETSLQAIYTAAKVAGTKVIAVTITPFKTSTSWNSSRQAVTDAVNTWILATATDVDYRYDAYTALEDPGAPDTLLAANASADKLHLSTVGYQLMATGIYGVGTWTSYGSTTGFLDLPVTTSSLNGTIRQNGIVLMHSYVPIGATVPNFFAGGAGNFSETGATGGNVAIGSSVLTALGAGVANTAVGYGALYTASSASNQSAFGKFALYNSNGGGNSAFGLSALQTISSGTYNTAMGYMAGIGATSANSPASDDYGILIGYQANRSVVTATKLVNYIGIGKGTLIDKDNQVKIGNTSITETQMYGEDLHLTTSGSLATGAVLTTTISNTRTGFLMVGDMTGYLVAMYRVENGALVLISGNAEFNGTKDNAATINVYYESNVIKIQNNVATTRAVSVRFSGFGL